MKFSNITLAASLLIAPCLLLAQADFSIGDYKFQVHGFASEGFMYSGNNNYLSAYTTNGSFAMTDAAANISTKITDKFTVGAQVYLYNVGKLGDWKPQLDWAMGSYQFKGWFGIRAGKVKTTFGLFNDTQDQSFLSTFAMLPQALYPIDRRDESLAHTGGDVYGSVPLKKRLGAFSYTAFAGNFADNAHSGYVLSLAPFGIDLKKFGGMEEGADLRWNTPVPGLLLGVSDMIQYPHGKGTCAATSPYCLYANEGGPGPFWQKYRKDFSTQFFGEYTRGPFTLDAEYRRTAQIHTFFSGAGAVQYDARAFYVSASYRLSRKFVLGSYYSRLLIHNIPFGSTAAGPPGYVLDKVAVLRYDATNYWNLKLEGHFMDGTGLPQVPWGFYSQVNPDGLQNKTPLLLIRSSWFF
jgi:hypothetical protein